MQDIKLTTIFLLGMVFTGFPLALAFLGVVWFFTQDISYLDFLSSNSTAAQYAAYISLVVGLLVGMFLSLNLVVYTNSRFGWLPETALKEKLGKELQRYVFVQHS